jgi:hypothetical protein
MNIQNIMFSKHDIKLVFLDMIKFIAYMSNSFCNTLHLNTVIK